MITFKIGNQGQITDALKLQYFPKLFKEGCKIVDLDMYHNIIRPCPLRANCDHDLLGQWGVIVESGYWSHSAKWILELKVCMSHGSHAR